MRAIPSDLTEVERRALFEVYLGPRTNVEVANALWPDSEGWSRPNGRGVQSLARNAAKVLHRLRARGLVTVEYGRVSRWRIAPYPLVSGLNFSK